MEIKLIDNYFFSEEYRIYHLWRFTYQQNYDIAQRALAIVHTTTRL